jgi:uncharacterized Zn finger protein
MAEALDRDPWLLFDLRGKTREDILAALQAKLDESAETQVPAPKKRGRPKKVVNIAELLARGDDLPDPWKRVDPEDYDRLVTELPDIIIPRQIPGDPAVFTQLGPLPHARIEASLCLAALMHRGAQWMQQQIEEGASSMEDGGDPHGEEGEPSPFDSPLPPPPVRTWKHRRRRWKTQG